MKYLINAGVYEILRGRLKAMMKPDANADAGTNEYRVTSLYFDDLYRTAYNDKLCGIMQRKKYRIRAYNLSPERITLECKYKDGDMVSKHNAIITQEQYNRILKGDYSFGYGGEFEGTAMEFLCFSASAVGMKPAVLVDYFREAYVNREGNVRITFDKKLSTSYGTMDMFDENITFSPVLNGYTILEVKYDEFIPSYIEEVLSGLPLLRESISKFLLCTDKLNSVRAY